ncbi:hypothetical protein [Crucivirus-250]|nr:hypothetical protein [Crucivirus-250]QMW68736.1 hypothetical protein [Crucivirus-251]
MLRLPLSTQPRSMTSSAVSFPSLRGDPEACSSSFVMSSLSNHKMFKGNPISPSLFLQKVFHRDVLQKMGNLVLNRLQKHLVLVRIGIHGFELRDRGKVTLGILSSAVRVLNIGYRVLEFLVLTPKGFVEVGVGGLSGRLHLLL